MRGVARVSGRSPIVLRPVLVRAIVFASVLFSVLAVPVVGHGDTPGSQYRDELIELARRYDLASDPHWLALGHYEKNTFGEGVESLATGSRFFLSPTGRTDPDAELAATIAALTTTFRPARK